MMYNRERDFEVNKKKNSIRLKISIIRKLIGLGLDEARLERLF